VSGTSPPQIPPQKKVLRAADKRNFFQLPNVDPSTGVRDKAVPYKVLMKFRRGKDPAMPGKACFGCNGVPKGSGIILVGDFVHVREWAEPGGV